MNRQTLVEQIRSKQSFLCVGLDTDIDLMPDFIKHSDDPVFEFNKLIIDATLDLCVAYKPNLAFYEALGVYGWQALEKTIKYIPKTHFTIADAKRGDIGNTSTRYAKAFFETLDFDAITVAPYMGEDSVKPFLGFKDKWVIVLALTSNQGSADFQMSTQADSQEMLFEKVLRKNMSWGTPENMMFVVGATHPESFADVRAICQDHFLLVPGIGAQGGSLSEVAKYGLNADMGLLVNASRAIQYASKGPDAAEKARAAAQAYQDEMRLLF